MSVIGLLLSCTKNTLEVDYLIVGGMVIDGTGRPSFKADVAINNKKIVFVGNEDTISIKAEHIVHAEGLVVSPGFIDPHTHSLNDLKSKGRNNNLNYLTQGVTTVMNGNDGEGTYNIDRLSAQLMAKGIGTNAAFLVGHGMVRNEILGREAVEPDSTQLYQMKELVRQGMEQGAFGLSAGLYYAPGSFAKTEEVIELAKVVKPYGGLYESHIRDESTYNIGLISAVEEAIRIGEEANVPVHIAHLKALGIDVWHKSDEIIEIAEKAQARGVTLTADQYPWIASGTNIDNALISRWVMAGGQEEYYSRLKNKSLLTKIRSEMKENLRKRGGANSILITADCRDTTMIGKTLAQIATSLNRDPISVALEIALNGGARIASFNMDEYDVMNLMKQPWVMTCSDGSKGHPRKYATYPQKYKEYVVKNQVLTLEEFIHKSSGMVANTFGIKNRGVIKTGNMADIIVFDKDEYTPMADFYHPEKLTRGMAYVFVNGKLAIDMGKYTGGLYGTVIKKEQR